MDEVLAAIPPALLLSMIIGAIHASIYVLLRGHLRLGMLLVLPSAILGAWIGQAVGARLGDPFRLGDYSLAWASALAWVGILIVAVLGTLVSTRGPGEVERG